MRKKSGGEHKGGGDGGDGDDVSAAVVREKVLPFPISAFQFESYISH
jgi:hypothetical protein